MKSKPFTSSTKLLVGTLLSIAAYTASAQSDPASEIRVDLTQAGAVMRSSDVIRLRNVTVTGHGSYWVDIQWQPAKLAFVPINIGTETNPNFAVTSNSFPASMYSRNPDYAAECVSEFGIHYGQADWSEIKSAIGTSTIELASFFNTIKMIPTKRYLATYGGTTKDNSSIPYYIQPSGSRTGADDVFDTLLSSMAVRSSTLAFEGQVICKKQS